ncbi:MAG: hypothetical protein IK077_03215 [Thermoguttaceae bacterium]|nr:hypothetical protein [Thermoguttaceae bacterium]
MVARLFAVYMIGASFSAFPARRGRFVWTCSRSFRRVSIVAASFAMIGASGTLSASTLPR